MRRNLNTEQVTKDEVASAWSRMAPGRKMPDGPTAATLLRRMNKNRFEFEILRHRGLAFDNEEI